MKRVFAVLATVGFCGATAWGQSAPTAAMPLVGIPVPIPPGTQGVKESVLNIPDVHPVIPQRMPSTSAPASTSPTPADSVSEIIDSINPFTPAIASPVSLESSALEQIVYQPRFWASAEYLLWWMKKGPLDQPVATMGSPNDRLPGALGQSGTSTLFGGSGLNYQQFSGLRVTAGGWLDQSGVIGLELSGLALLEQSARFAAAGNGDRNIARPYVNAITGAESAFVVSGPGVAGSLHIESKSNLWSGEANGLVHLHQGAFVDVALLGGFRIAELDENIQLDQTSRNLVPNAGVVFQGNAVDPGSSVSIHDGFGAQNRFYGPQAGVRFRVQRDILFVDVTTKIAAGVNHEQMTIEGNTTLNGPHPATAAGGFLASGSNLGSYSRDRFALMPEGTLQLGAQIRPWLVVRMGYNFIYWSETVRPGTAIDRTVNPNRVPTSAGFGSPDGGNRPGFTFRNSDYWVHGMTVGLEMRY